MFFTNEICIHLLFDSCLTNGDTRMDLYMVRPHVANFLDMRPSGMKSEP